MLLNQMKPSELTHTNQSKLYKSPNSETTIEVTTAASCHMPKAEESPDCALFVEYKISGSRPGSPSSLCEVGGGGCSWIPFSPQCGIDKGNVINGIDQGMDPLFSSMWNRSREYHQCGIYQVTVINVPIFST